METWEYHEQYDLADLFGAENCWEYHIFTQLRFQLGTGIRFFQEQLGSQGFWPPGRSNN